MSEIDLSKNLFNHILVAVDGSDNSRRAVITAGSLAMSYKAKVTLISVYRHVSYTNRRYNQVNIGPIDDASPVELSLHSLAEESVNKSEVLLRELKVENIACRVRRGPPASIIIKTAKEIEVDAIVIGSRGYGEIEGILLGSVSHKVNALSPCTCITVK